MQQEQQTYRAHSAPSLDELRSEVARLRRTLLKHGHAQELFHERVENAIGRMVTYTVEGLARGERDAARPAAGGSLSTAQRRTLVELDQAVRNLKDLATGGPAAATVDEDSPRSIREGLDLLGIRVSNLQRSFGLERVPALGRPFDDRLHRVHGVCQCSDLPDGYVVEELLPGFLLDGEVERPALVIVNRLASDKRQDEECTTFGATR